MPANSPRRFHRVLAQIGAKLLESSTPYMVIGGQAVMHHGEFRNTKDIDLTMALPPYAFEQIMSVLKQCGLEPLVDDPRDWVIKTHVLPCGSEEIPMRVDISFTDSPYERQAIARGVDVEILGVPVRFASVEDLLIHKIIAWRGVDQQDCRGILLKNPQADIDDVRHWLALFAEALDEPLLDRLDHALRDADWANRPDA